MHIDREYESLLEQRSILAHRLVQAEGGSREAFGILHELAKVKKKKKKKRFESNNRNNDTNNHEDIA